MSWIKKHWAKDYITLAESQIWQLVSPFAYAFKHFSHSTQDAGILQEGQHGSTAYADLDFQRRNAKVYVTCRTVWPWHRYEYWGTG